MDLTYGVSSADDSDWATCPYNSSHRVPRTRMQNHVVKCAKNCPKLEICPYNATHRYPAEIIKEHCKNCPQKPVIIDSKTGGMIMRPKPILQREYLPETDPNHECWDD